MNASLNSAITFLIPSSSKFARTIYITSYFVILRANLDEEGIKNVIAELSDAFTSNDSTVLECKELGLKDLAYEINHMRKGYYVLLNVEATAEACNEFTRRANINENVMRHIVVKAA